MARTIDQTQTEVDFYATVTKNGGVTGLTATVKLLAASTASDATPLYLDWDDNTFKTVGWTTKAAPLVDVTDAPGHYAKDNSSDVFDPSSVSALPAGERKLVAVYEFSGTEQGTIQETLEYPDFEKLYEGGIWVQDGGVSGSVLGVHGTRNNPVGNDSDANTLATSLGVNKYYVVGGPSSFTLSVPHTDREFIGKSAVAIVNAGSQSCVRCCFTNVTVSGTFGASSDVVIENGTLSNLSGFSGTARRCNISGTVTMAFFANFIDCSGTGSGAPVIDVNGFGFFFVNGYNGALQIDNMSVAGSVGEVRSQGLDLTIDSTCTQGSIRAQGVGALVDNSGPSCAVDFAGFIPESLNDLSIGDIQTELDNRNLTAVRVLLLDQLDVATAGGVAEYVTLIRKIAQNRIGTVGFGTATTTQTVYDDDGTTPLLTATLSTDAGGDVLTAPGIQVNRTAFS